MRIFLLTNLVNRIASQVIAYPTTSTQTWKWTGLECHTSRSQVSLMKIFRSRSLVLAMLGPFLQMMITLRQTVLLVGRDFPMQSPWVMKTLHLTVHFLTGQVMFDLSPVMENLKTLTKMISAGSVSLKARGQSLTTTSRSTGLGTFAPFPAMASLTSWILPNMSGQGNLLTRFQVFCLRRMCLLIDRVIFTLFPGMEPQLTVMRLPLTGKGILIEVCLICLIMMISSRDLETLDRSPAMESKRGKTSPTLIGAELLSGERQAYLTKMFPLIGLVIFGLSLVLVNQRNKTIQKRVGPDSLTTTCLEYQIAMKYMIDLEMSSLSRVMASLRKTIIQKCFGLGILMQTLREFPKKIKSLKGQGKSGLFREMAGPKTKIILRCCGLAVPMPREFLMRTNCTNARATYSPFLVTAGLRIPIRRNSPGGVQEVSSQKTMVCMTGIATPNLTMIGPTISPKMCTGREKSPCTTGLRTCVQCPG